MKSIPIVGTLSRRQRKAGLKLGRDLDAIQKGVSFIVLAILAVSMIQGKLGFKKSMREADFSVSAQAVYDALFLDAAGYFSVPFVDMLLLETLIKNYNVAIKNSQMKILGSAGAKKAAKTSLYGCLKSALNYVNQLAWNLQAVAEELITSANMLLKEGNSFKKQDFVVRKGASSGEVILACLAVQIDGKYVKASYNWQSSVDGGKTWVDLNNTNEAKLDVLNLQVGAIMKFRKRTNSTKGGISKWSTPVDFTVL